MWDIIEQVAYTLADVTVKYGPSDYIVVDAHTNIVRSPLYIYSSRVERERVYI